jgi:protein gp37
MTHYEPTIEEALEAFNIKGVHPAANLLPLITGDDFQALCESIGKYGLEEPVVFTHDGRLLDGRNRLRALLVTGQTERFKTLDEVYAADYIGYVDRLNYQRRHLTASQKAVYAIEKERLYAEEAKERQLSKLKQNQAKATVVEIIPQRTQPLIETVTVSEPLKAREQAAKETGVNDRYIQDAKKIAKEDPVTLEKVRAGEITIPQAMKEIKKKEQATKPYITLSDWKAKGMQSVPTPDSKAKLNRQSDTSEDQMGNIEWASWSWNPVTGCKHDCSYCYARDIANRFWGDSYGFEPTIHPERLRAPYNHKPKDNGNPADKNVFANSMSDLYGRWVPQEWIDAVFKSMADNPQWNFLTLTKFPKRAAELSYPSNVWIGTSVDLQARVKAAEDAFERIQCGVRWLSIEPMIEPLTFTRPELFDWVVIGGASRSSKTPEWTPPFSWIVRVASQFLEHGAKIYLKTNGRPREYPGVIVPETADEAFYYLRDKT